MRSAGTDGCSKREHVLRWVMGWAGNEGLEKMWEAVVVAYFQVQNDASICLEVTMKATKTCSTAGTRAAIWTDEVVNMEGDWQYADCTEQLSCRVHRTGLTLILRRSRTGTVWFYTSTSNKRAARPKLYTESLTRDLKCMYSRLTLVRISINL